MKITLGLRRMESCAAEHVKYVELESSDEGTEPVNDQVSDSSTIGDMDQSPLSLRRSERVRRRPDYYIEGTSVASQYLDEPCTFEEALSSPSRAKWEKAMETEMESLHNNHIWDLVKLPKEQNCGGYTK